MNEVCAILGIGGIVMVVVMLIGHGLWVICAAILRALTGKTSTKPAIFSPAYRFDPAATTLTHLNQLYARGLIDLKTLNELRNAIAQGSRSHTPFDRLAAGNQAMRPAPPPLPVTPIEQPSIAPAPDASLSTEQKPQPPVFSTPPYDDRGYPLSPEPQPQTPIAQKVPIEI